MFKRDNRAWWLCGAANSPAKVYEGRTRRQALAKHRRALIAAEMAKGCSQRHAVRIVRAAALQVLNGDPMSTTAAHALDLGWRLAWAAYDKQRLRGVPSGPMSAQDARTVLSAREIELIATNVARRFAPATSGGHHD